MIYNKIFPTLIEKFILSFFLKENLIKSILKFSCQISLSSMLC